MRARKSGWMSEGGKVAKASAGGDGLLVRGRARRRTDLLCVPSEGSHSVRQPGRAFSEGSTLQYRLNAVMGRIGTKARHLSTPIRQVGNRNG